MSGRLKRTLAAAAWRCVNSCGTYPRIGRARYGAVGLKSFYRCGVIVVGRLGVESRELIELRRRSEAD